MAMRASAGDGSGAASATCDLLVTNGCVVTLDAERRIYDPGAIAVTGNAILAVGPQAAMAGRWRPRKGFDARGGIVHPGFIDAHNHIVHTTCRGLLDNRREPSRVSFADWKADVRSEDEYAATQFACLELLRNGFTMFIEPGTAFDNDAVAEAVEAVGLRALLADCYLWDQVEIMKHLGSLESRSLYDRAPPNRERCLKQLGGELHRNKNPNALVRGYVSVYGLGTASDELLKAAKHLADTSSVVFQQHEGYVPAASRADRERLGRSRIAHLAELGVLGENSCLIHMNVMDDSDIALIAGSGTSVIWCSAAYLQLGISAEAPCRLPELRERGGHVALGLDGALNCAIGDAAHCAYLVAASVGRPITPGAVLEMETIEAARAAGLADRIGSLETGKRADIVIRRSDLPEVFPGVNPAHQLALTARAGTVDTVIVEGRIVMKNGRSTMIDEERVLAEARASVLRRMARLEVAPTPYWPIPGAG